MTNPFAQTAPTQQPPANPFANPTHTGGAPAHTPQPAGNDPFGQPAPRLERPRVRDLYGRLLLIIPKRLEHNVVSTRLKNKDGSPQVQDRMTGDVIVLDGGPLAYGGAPEATPPSPHTREVAPPYRFTDMFLSGKGIVAQSREALAKRERNEPGMVLGRLTRESGQNKPWLLSPYTPEDAALARAYLSAVNPFE